MNFEDLIEHLSPKLKAISQKVKRRYTYCDEDDFYQEASLFLWMRFREGSLMDKTDSYILQGCYYFLKNYIRTTIKKIDANSVSLSAPANEEGHTIGDLIISSETCSRGIDSIEIYLLLSEVKEDFTEREKDIFYYKLEGLTTREIGLRIGISHVMVVKTINNIREKCKILKEATTYASFSRISC